MVNKPLIHINRKYHIPFDEIICIKQRKRGVYVQFHDKKTKMTLYAIHKGNATSLLNVLNTTRIMKGMKPMELVVEE